MVVAKTEMTNNVWGVTEMAKIERLEARIKELERQVRNNPPPTLDLRSVQSTKAPSGELFMAHGYLDRMGQERQKASVAGSQSMSLYEDFHQELEKYRTALEVSQARLETMQACLLAADRMALELEDDHPCPALVAYRAAREKTR